MSLDIQKNELHYYIDLLRAQYVNQKKGEESETNVQALNNIIRIMRLSRHDKIYGENFSKLDFGNIPFREIRWSENGEYSCNFNECQLNEGNFLYGHNSWIRSVAWTPNGKYIITTDMRGIAIIWNVYTGMMVRKIEGVEGTLAISPNSLTFLSASYDNTIILCDILSGSIVRTFKGSSGIVNSVAFSPDGNLVITSFEDGKVILWDINTGVIVKSFDVSSDWICNVQLLSDGKYCVLSSYSHGFVSLWDTYSWKEIRSFKINITSNHSIALSPDGRICLMGTEDNNAIMLDVNSGKVVKILQGHSEEINSVAFSYDGKLCITGASDNTCKIWETQSGKCLHTLKGHTHSISSVSFSPDGKYCVTGAWDMSAKIWNVQSGSCIWNLKGHNNEVGFAAISSEGYNCLIESKANTVMLWDVVSGKVKNVIHIPDDNSFQYVLSSFVPGLLSARIIATAFSSIYKCVLTASWDQNSAKLWSLNSGKLLHTLNGHTECVMSVAFSPDGRYCLTGSRDKTAILWNVITGRMVKKLNGHSDYVSSVAFSPDGRYCLTGSYDKTAILWSIDSGEIVRRFIGHSFCIHSVAFSPHGMYCLTGSRDNSVKLWDLSTGNCKLTINKLQTEWIDMVTFTSDGRYIVVGSRNTGVVCLCCATTGSCLRTWNSFSTNIIWQFPFLCEPLEYTTRIWKLPSNAKEEPRIIDTLYNIEDIYVHECSFIGVTTSEKTKKILFQYGGVTDSQKEN